MELDSAALFLVDFGRFWTGEPELFSTSNDLLNESERKLVLVVCGVFAFGVSAAPSESRRAERTGLQTTRNCDAVATMQHASPGCRRFTGLPNYVIQAFSPGSVEVSTGGSSTSGGRTPQPALWKQPVESLDIRIYTYIASVANSRGHGPTGGFRGKRGSCSKIELQKIGRNSQSEIEKCKSN